MKEIFFLKSMTKSTFFYFKKLIVVQKGPTTFYSLTLNKPLNIKLYSRTLQDLIYIKIKNKNLNLVLNF